MKHAPLRLIALLIIVLAAGLGGYAVASSGSSPNAWTPLVSCQPGGFLRVAGAAPRSATTAYLVFSDGASLSAKISRRSYAFRLPPGFPNGAPSLLRFADQRNQVRDTALAQRPFSDCGAARAPTLYSSASARLPRTPLTRAIDLINQAREIAQRTSRACGNGMAPPPRLTLSNGSPPAAMLAVLGVLRRPQTSTDRLAQRQLEGRVDGPPGVLTVYRRYTRVVPEQGGITARIAVGMGQESLPKSALYPCLHAATRTLIRLLRDQPHAIRHEALKLQLGYKLGPQTHGVHPWLDYSAAGGTGGPFDLHNFRAHGTMIEGCGMTSPPPGANPRAPGVFGHPKLECDLNGLVPDGVATITLRLTGEAHYTNLFGRPSPYYRLHHFTRTIPVHENAWAFANLPSDPASAGHQTLTWRDKHGRVLHVEHFP